ncbi:hypothetical protein AWC38_SpisGene6994 [Stylophora pistillata]|uniref:Uncharacterized protein n=1 Tax=Stylophora pistillata TaxID=50429 RepID=A0A2B4SIC7_STYPI|nr:hypothetical protein AWC38_SpisGene6994 [Stylophora pistillata]
MYCLLLDHFMLLLRETKKAAHESHEDFSFTQQDLVFLQGASHKQIDKKESKKPEKNHEHCKDGGRLSRSKARN